MVVRYVIAVMFSGTLGGLIQAAKKLEISLASQFANDIGNREFVSRGKPYIASAWMNHNTAIASDNVSVVTVIEHYDKHFSIDWSEKEKRDH